MLLTLFFSLSSKCGWFHNATLFGSSIIRILHTGCVKFKCQILVKKVNVFETETPWGRMQNLSKRMWWVNFLLRLHTVLSQTVRSRDIWSWSNVYGDGGCVGDLTLEMRPDYTIPFHSGPLTYVLNSIPRAGRNSSWSDWMLFFP
jgi:hypothetical protein